jgi:hypothetical protein
VARRTYQRDPFRDGQTTAVTVVEQAAVDLSFDYSTVPEAYRELVRRSALTIKPRLKRAAEDIFVIGKELKATKAWLPHGEYTRWLDVEFGLSDRMAQRFVNVYERLGAKSDIMSDLPPTTLYLLAAPSTPDEAIQTVEQQLDTGEHVSVSYVQQVIAETKQKARRSMADNLVINGAVTHQEWPEEEARQAQAVQRLETTLTTMLDLLSDQSLADWAILFQTEALHGVRAEILQLKAALQKKRMGSPATV